VVVAVWSYPAVQRVEDGVPAAIIAYRGGHGAAFDPLANNIRRDAKPFRGFGKRYALATVNRDDHAGRAGRGLPFLGGAFVASTRPGASDPGAPGADSATSEGSRSRRVAMHAVIRKYTADPEVAKEMQSKAAHLEQTMRQTPGFVAYYFLTTDDGVATITITEDAAGTQESMGRAANWVRDNLTSKLGPPEVIRGETLISTTR
jgi:hypothetical protein